MVWHDLRKYAGSIAITVSSSPQEKSFKRQKNKIVAELDGVQANSVHCNTKVFRRDC